MFHCMYFLFSGFARRPPSNTPMPGSTTLTTQTTSVHALITVIQTVTVIVRWGIMDKGCTARYKLTICLIFNSHRMECVTQSGLQCTWLTERASMRVDCRYVIQQVNSEPWRSHGDVSSHWPLSEWQIHSTDWLTHALMWNERTTPSYEWLKLSMTNVNGSIEVNNLTCCTCKGRNERNIDQWANWLIRYTITIRTPLFRRLPAGPTPPNDDQAGQCRMRQAAFVSET